MTAVAWFRARVARVSQALHAPIRLTGRLAGAVAGRPCFAAQTREDAEDFFISSLARWRDALGLDKVRTGVPSYCPQHTPRFTAGSTSAWQVFGDVHTCPGATISQGCGANMSRSARQHTVAWRLVSARWCGGLGHR